MSSQTASICPPDALNTAVKRKKMLESGEATTTMNEKSHWIVKLQDSAEDRQFLHSGKARCFAAAQIRALRLRRTWKQEELAQKAGMKTVPESQLWRGRDC